MRLIMINHCPTLIKLMNRKYKKYLIGNNINIFTVIFSLKNAENNYYSFCINFSNITAFNIDKKEMFPSHQISILLIIYLVTRKMFTVTVRSKDY